MGTKVRILAALQLDGVSYQPNQVVDMPPAAAKAFTADGQVDANKDAVNYCIKELGAEVIVHGAVEEPAAAPSEPPAE
jgi:ABC-type nitrate/sulfonate/bicarbonate transport system substrate-binding protein